MSDFYFSNGNGKNSYLNGKSGITNFTTSGFSSTKVHDRLPESSGALVVSPEPSGSLFTIPETSSALVPFGQPVNGDLLHQNTPNEYLPPIGRWISICGVTMVGIFCSAIGLSSVLKYKTTVQAAATIRPQGELRLVQATIEGSVLSIRVRENQVVKRGELIATVKDLRLESKLKTKRSQLIGEMLKGKQQVSKIDAQISALDRQNLGEQEQIDRSVATIQSELSRAQRDYQDKQQLSQAEVTEAMANIETAKKDKQAAEMDLRVADANLKSIQAAYQAAITKRNRYQEAITAGAISKNLFEEAQLAAEQQAQAVAAGRATIAKQTQTIARLHQIIISVETRLTRARVALNPSRAEMEQVSHKIERERANGKTAIARFQQERQKLLQQQLEMRDRIATNDRELAQVATDLQPTPILAPIGGTIQDLNLRNNGQVVHPGDSLARILPTGTQTQIKAYIALADIGKVNVGQTVQMRVSACPYTDYGVLAGKVTEVSADAKSSDKSKGQNSDRLPTGANAYEVTIKPNTFSLGTNSNNCQIRSGMEGRADIIAKEESVFQFLASKARLLVDP